MTRCSYLPISSRHESFLTFGNYSAGDAEYTISNKGVRMLYVDPFNCKQPATSLSTWVIELDQPETVYSIQVSVVDGTMGDFPDEGNTRFKEISTSGAQSLAQITS